MLINSTRCSRIFCIVEMLHILIIFYAHSIFGLNQDMKDIESFKMLHFSIITHTALFSVVKQYHASILTYIYCINRTFFKSCSDYNHSTDCAFNYKL